MAEVTSGAAGQKYPNLGVATESFGGTETVLLVEDEAFVREGMYEVLEAAGYCVVTAKNATEALACYERLTRVDLLLTDVVLPGESGRVLAETLRSLQPTVTVLFMTGYPEQLAEITALEPAEACLPKPFSAAAMLRRVRQVLNGRTDPSTGNSITRVCGIGLPA